MNTGSKSTPFGEQHRRALCRRKLRAAQERGHGDRPGGDRPHSGGADRPLSPDRPQPDRRAGSWCGWCAITGSRAPAWRMACGCATARRNGSAAASSSTSNAAKVLSRKPIPGPGRRQARRQRQHQPHELSAASCAPCVEAGSIPVELDYELEQRPAHRFRRHARSGLHRPPAFRSGHARAPRARVRAVPAGPLHLGRQRWARDDQGADRPAAHSAHPRHGVHAELHHRPRFPGDVSAGAFAHASSRGSGTSAGRRESASCRAAATCRAIQWFEAPRCFAFHFANAYDDGDLTIIDLPKHKRMFLTDQNGPNEGAPIMVRWTLHRPSGRLTETVIDDRGNEFPRINGRHSGQAYRYIYTRVLGRRRGLRPGDEARPRARDDRGPRLWPRAG